MPSAVEKQEQDPPQHASHEEAVSKNMHVEPPSSSQIEEEYHALASKTADLDLEDQSADTTLSSKDANDTWSDEEAPSETIDENSEPQLAHTTSTAPTEGVQADQSKPTENMNNADNAAATRQTNPSASQDEDHDDETNTPRFQTYVKLHNEVRPTSSFPSHTSFH